MLTFNGPAKGTTISLPADMWEYLRLRAEREDRKLSTIVRRAIEADILGTNPDRVMLDEKARYEVEG